MASVAQLLGSKQQTRSIGRALMNRRSVFVPIAAAQMACDSLGVTIFHDGLFAFEHVTWPIYPLDTQTEWRATKPVNQNEAQAST